METFKAASGVSDESGGTGEGLPKAATLAELDLRQCLSIRRVVDDGTDALSLLDFELDCPGGSSRFRAGSEKEVHEWLGALHSADHTLRQLAAAEAARVERERLEAVTRNAALAALRAEAALLELDAAPKAPFYLCASPDCLRVGVQPGSCGACGVVPVPAESVRPPHQLRGGCLACWAEASDLALEQGTAGVAFSCGHWLCLRGIEAHTLDLDGSCFVSSVRSLLENNPDAVLSLAPDRRATATRYTLRCQSCAHGRLHTVDILALLGEATYAMVQQLCVEAQDQAAHQKAQDLKAEGTDLLGINASLTLSRGSAGHTVIVVEEWERRPMLDFRRDPSAEQERFYSKATLLPTDPHSWASPDGQPCAKEEPRLLLPGWRWESEWRPAVDAGGKTDGAGWQYTFGAGPNGWKPHHLESAPGVKPWQITFLRKRRWERMVAVRTQLILTTTATQGRLSQTLASG